MKFNTAEGQSLYVFRALLGNLYLYYQADSEGCETFDEYLHSHLKDLGEVAYEFVGEYFGDADEAVTDLGLGE